MAYIEETFQAPGVIETKNITPEDGAKVRRGEPTKSQHLKVKRKSILKSRGSTWLV